MTDARVEVLPDTTAIDGGRAILRLMGVYDLPIDATYRIDPVDDQIDAADPGWPNGDRRPDGSHLGHDGIELMIGPDVVEAQLLAPGTDVVLSVPAADLRVTLRWPDIHQSKSCGQIKLLPPPPPRPEDFENAAVDASLAAAISAKPDPAKPDPAEPDRTGLEDLAAANTVGAHPGDDRPATEPTEFEHAGFEDAGRGDVNAPDNGDAFAAGSATDPLASAPDTDDTTDFETERAHPDDVQQSETAEQDEGVTSPGFRHVDDPYDRPYPVRMRPRYLPRPNLVRPFLMGVSLAGLLGLAAWLGFQNEIALYVQKVAKSRLVEVGAITPVAPSAAATLTKVINIGETSPRGETVTGVGINDALARANTGLRRQPPDFAEARFWLRKAVGMSLGSREMTWALTQLGTLYAVDGASQTDYARARMLWELAASQGDTVALCFLGAVNQKGLGGPADAERAKSLYARARKLGGCKEAENPTQRPLPSPP